MKHYLIIQLLFLCTIAPAMAQYYSVNYDTRTVAEMSAAFGTEAATEAYYAQQIAKIREHYQAAEVAAAGIFSSKFLDRRALTNLGLWTSATENYYYRRIYNMVRRRSGLKLLIDFKSTDNVPLLREHVSHRTGPQRRLFRVFISHKV